MNVASLVHDVAVGEQQPVRRKEEPGTTAAPLPLAIPLHDIQVHDGGSGGGGGRAEGLGKKGGGNFVRGGGEWQQGVPFGGDCGGAGGVQKGPGRRTCANPPWGDWG